MKVQIMDMKRAETRRSLPEGNIYFIASATFSKSMTRTALR